jgi:hypothetical protein
MGDSMNRKIINDICKIREVVQRLRSVDSELFADLITLLQQRLENMEAQVRGEAERVAVEAKAAEQTFVQKYGAATVHGVEIVLLAIIAGKLLGAF